MTQRQEKLIENYVRTKVRTMLKESLNPTTQRSIQTALWKILEKIRGNVDPSVYSSGEEFLKALNREFGSTVTK